MIIDAHIHIWDVEKSNYQWLQEAAPLLKRTYAINELERSIEIAGITAGVFIQADNQMEDSFHMLEVARHTDWIKGVVTWLPLTDTDTTSRLLEDKLLNDEYFVGVRHLIHDEKDPKWLLQPAVIESLKLLAAYKVPYDIIGVLPEHIETVLEVANRVPDLKMVFDHLNHPPISKDEQFGKWGDLMQEAAANKNFYVKISGLGTVAGVANFTAEKLLPYVDFIIGTFTAEHCFCGGDWPVSLLAADYVTTWDIYKEVIGRIVGKVEAENIFSKNAINFYNLNIDMHSLS